MSKVVGFIDKIYHHKTTGNEIYIGTTKEAVAEQILKTLDSRISFWTNRKERFLKNYD